MRSRLPHRLALARSALGCLLVAGSLAPRLDVPGFAELTSPAAGQAVSGVVIISGTANHPAFESFEVGFGYDPDQTDTWFPIADRVSTPVIDDRLAIWDTTGISDGNYRVRLLVHLADGRVLEAILSGIRVRNYTPTETPTGPEAGVSAATSLPPTPTATRPAEVRPVQPASTGNPFSQAFSIGALAAAVALIGLGAYAILAPRVRAHLAYLRMRQLHHRTDKARGTKQR